MASASRYPLVSFDTNPLATSVLEQKLERRLRTAWTLVPNVGFVLAAMVPSLSVPWRCPGSMGSHQVWRHQFWRLN
eukprot:Skav211362  [mRNA]  locus=scaffold677:433052:433279:- [translate_table: standard]